MAGCEVCLQLQREVAATDANRFTTEKTAAAKVTNRNYTQSETIKKNKKGDTQRRPHDRLSNMLRNDYARETGRRTKTISLERVVLKNTVLCNSSELQVRRLIIQQPRI
jgi:hypothetical protein